MSENQINLPEFNETKVKKNKTTPILIGGLLFLFLFISVVGALMYRYAHKPQKGLEPLAPVAEASQSLPQQQQQQQGFNQSTQTPLRHDPFVQNQDLTKPQAPSNSDAKIDLLLAKLEELSAAQVDQGARLARLDEQISLLIARHEASLKAEREHRLAISQQNQMNSPLGQQNPAVKKNIVKTKLASIERNEVKKSSWYVSTAIGNRVWISNGIEERSIASGERVEALGMAETVDPIRRTVVFDTGVTLYTKNAD